MAELNINGQKIVLPRYNLNIMTVAGPFMDEIFKVMEAGEAPTKFSELNALVGNLTGFLAAGASRVQADLTQERLGDIYSMADAELLQKVVEDVFADMGTDMKGNPLPKPAVEAPAAEPVAADPPAADVAAPAAV